MVIAETRGVTAAMPGANFQRHGTPFRGLRSTGARTLARIRNGSNEQPGGFQECSVSIWLIPRANARLHVDAAAESRIKGGRWDVLLALWRFLQLSLSPNRPLSQESYLCLQPPSPLSLLTGIPKVLIPQNLRKHSQGRLENPPPRFSTPTMTPLSTRIIGQRFGWPLTLCTTVPDAYALSQRDHTRTCR